MSKKTRLIVYVIVVQMIVYFSIQDHICTRTNTSPYRFTLSPSSVITKEQKVSLETDAVVFAREQLGLSEVHTSQFISQIRAYAAKVWETRSNPYIHQIEAASLGDLHVYVREIMLVHNTHVAIPFSYHHNDYIAIVSEEGRITFQPLLEYLTQYPPNLMTVDQIVKTGHFWPNRFKQVLNLPQEGSLAETISALITASEDEFYWVRVAAMARLSQYPLADIMHMMDHTNPLHQEILVVVKLIQRGNVMQANQEIYAQEQQDMQTWLEKKGNVTIAALVEKKEDMRFEGIRKREEKMYEALKEEPEIAVMSRRIHVKTARMFTKRSLLSPDGSFQARLDYSGTQYVRGIVLWQMAFDALKIANMQAQGISAEGLLKDIIGFEEAQQFLEDRVKPFLRENEIKTVSIKTHPEMVARLLGMVSYSWLNSSDGGRMGAMLTDKEGNVICVATNEIASSWGTNTELMGGEIRANDCMPLAIYHDTQHKDGEVSLDTRARDVRFRRSICAEQKALILAWLLGQTHQIAEIYTRAPGCSQCQRLVQYPIGRKDGRDHYASSFRDDLSANMDTITLKLFPEASKTCHIAPDVNKGQVDQTGENMIVQYLNEWIISHRTAARQIPHITTIADVMSLDLSSKEIMELLRDIKFEQMVLMELRSRERDRRMRTSLSYKTEQEWENAFKHFQDTGSSLGNLWMQYIEWLGKQGKRDQA